MPLDAAGRRRRAKIAAHALHAQGKTNTAPALKAFEQKWLNLADPTGELDPVERAKRAAHLRAAHYLRVSAAMAAGRVRARNTA